MTYASKSAKLKRGAQPQGKAISESPMPMHSRLKSHFAHHHRPIIGHAESESAAP